MRISQEITTSTEITDVNVLLICNSADPIALTLGKQALGKSYGYYIKNIGAGIVTITPVLNDLIDGQATKILAQYEAVLIMDYKVNNWLIISNNYVV